MTYSVFGGTLSLTQSINQLLCFYVFAGISCPWHSISGLSVRKFRWEITVPPSVCIRDHILTVC